MKKLLAIVLMTTCSGLLASETPQQPVKKPVKKNAFLYYTGGKIQRPDSFTGKIVFVNAQSKYSEAALAKIVNWGANNLEYNMVCEKGEPIKGWSWGYGAKILKDHAAQLAIALVDDPTLPPLVTVPEEGWSVVNVAKLAEGLDLDEALQKKMFEARCDKEAFRAFSMIGGGFCAVKPGTALNAATVKELDALPNELPFDTINLYKAYLKKRGITPRVMVHYNTACREGWAPSPTNEYQKAAWERVHALPTNPLPLVKPTK